MARRLKIASVRKRTRHTRKSRKRDCKYLMYCNTKKCVDRFAFDRRGTTYLGMVLMYGTNDRSEIMDVCNNCKNNFYHRTNLKENRFEGIFYQEGDYIYVNP